MNINLAQIVFYEKNIDNNIIELQENLATFKKQVEEITIIINTLKEIYNTTNGENFIKKISNIEFDCVSLEKIIEDTSSIKSNHETYEEIISVKEIDG